MGEVLLTHRCPVCPWAGTQATCPRCGGDAVRYRVTLE